MINPIANSVQPYEPAQTRNPASTGQQPANPAQDSVQLSSQARSAGDVDHDGDSH